MIRGVILAAGRGSRLHGLTADNPKCLVELSGRPLLHWQLSAMREAGVEPVCIVGGYRFDMLQGRGAEVLVNDDWSNTNMVASLCVAMESLPGDDTLVVSYSDIVYSSHHVEQLAEGDGDIALTYDEHWLHLWRKRFDDPLSDGETFRIKDGRVLDIGRRIEDLDSVDGQFMGLFKLTPSGRRAILDFFGSEPGLRDRLDMTALLGLLLARGVDVRGIPVRGGWCEVDTARDLAVANDLLREGHLPGLERE